MVVDFVTALLCKFRIVDIVGCSCLNKMSVVVVALLIFS